MENEISHIYVQIKEGKGEIKAAIAFITSRPSHCWVEYGPTKALGQRSVIEERPANNHRLILPGLNLGKKYYYRVLAQDEKGKEVRSEILSLVAELARVKSKVDRKRVRISVDWPTTAEGPEEAGGKAWPVTLGVPILEGELATAEEVRLLGSKEEEIPGQFQVLGPWPDGSVKWLLIDFQAQLGQKQYLLEYGNEVKPKKFESPLRVSEDKGETAIETGPLKFVVSEGGPLPISALWLRKGEKFIPALGRSDIVLRDPQGRIFRATPETIEMEEAGPLRAVIKITGHHTRGAEKLFTFTLRIHAYAGKSFLSIFYTFANDNLQEKMTQIKSIILDLDLDVGEDPRYLLGREEPISGKVTKKVICLEQKYDDKFSLLEGGRMVLEGRRALGTALLAGEKYGACLWLEDFWQNYPKTLTIAPSGISLGICPTISPEDYQDKELEDKLYFYLQHGVYKFKQGVSKTHKMVLYLHQEDAEAAGVKEFCQTLAHPPLAHLSPTCYAGSKAFGDIWPEDRERYGFYEDNVERFFQDFLRRREQGKEYGMLNYGDWYGEREFNWGNQEYDTPHGLLLQFVRSADRRAFLAGSVAAVHFRDVDTIHYSENPDDVGTIYFHSLCHTGGYYPSGFKGMADGYLRGGHNLGHIWVDGLLDHFFLTGDRRSLEVATRIGLKVAFRVTTDFDFGNCRSAGWPLILTMAMYNATYDKAYLNAAKIMVEKVLQRQTPDRGGWVRRLSGGHCRHTPPHYGNAAFMVGVLLSGLKKYHRETQDERVAKSIIAASDYLINELWIPKNKCFRYTSCPDTRPLPDLNILILDGIAYAYRLTGEKRFEQIAREGLMSATASGFGKSLSFYIGFAPHILYHMASHSRARP